MSNYQKNCRFLVEIRKILVRIRQFWRQLDLLGGVVGWWQLEIALQSNRSVMMRESALGTEAVDLSID